MQYMIRKYTRRLQVAALFSALLLLVLPACAVAPADAVPATAAVTATQGTAPSAAAENAPALSTPAPATPASPAVAAETAPAPEAAPASASAPVSAPTAAPAPEAAAPDDGYRLGIGDRISITVLGERDLSLDLFVDDQGEINYPFLGEIKVAGLTINQLGEAITDGLKPDYLLDPRVTVQVMEYRKFFVNGEVQRPGGFSWQPGMTVRKAVALAGGFTARAARSKLLIIREADVAQLPAKVEIDSPVAPGDIVTIDQSFF